MPTIIDLGKKVKQKYPDYNDLSDEEVGRRTKEKYPEYNDFQDIQPREPVQPVQPIQQNPYGALFRATGEETPITAGLKAAGNIPTSAFGLAKGLAGAVAHPIQTVTGIGKTLGSGIEKLIPGEQFLERQAREKGRETEAEAFGSLLKERYGSLENLQKTAIEDPFSFGADIFGIIGGGATLAGRGRQFAALTGKTGQLVTRPTKAIATGAGRTVGKTAGFSLSQGIGINPETITELIRNPSRFKNVPPELRVETARNVKNALTGRLEELKGVGKEYDVLRNVEGKVIVPKGAVKGVFDKYRVKLDEEGKIIVSPESRPLSITDRNALQSFLDTYGKERELTANSFLNVREALSQLGKYEQGKTNVPIAIARELRKTYDFAGKRQIKGLKELDIKFAPEKRLLGGLRKELFDSKGNLKDNAISKIANLKGKGKEQLLGRVKQVVPDIEERVSLIRAVEDIEYAMKIRPGTYVRAGTALFGVTTANPVFIIGAILSQPQIAVPILRSAGFVGQKAAPIVRALRNIANDLNNFRLPKISGLKTGLSIEDVSKSQGLSALSRSPAKNKIAISESKLNISPSISQPPKKVKQGLLPKARAAKLAEEGFGNSELVQEAIPESLSRLSKQAKGVSFETFKRKLVSNIGSVDRGEKIPDDVANAVFKRLQATAQRGEFSDETKLFKDLGGRKPERLKGKELAITYRAAPDKSLRPGDFVSFDKSEAGFYLSSTKKIFIHKIPKEDLVLMKGSIGGGQELIYLPKGHKVIEPIEYYKSVRDFYNQAVKR